MAPARPFLRLLPLSAALLSSIPRLATGAQAPQAAGPTFDEVVTALQNLRPDGERVATVQDLVIERDAARFTLAQGTLSILTPVAGRTIGVLFEGRGTFALTAPTAAESDQLQRFLGRRELAEPFTGLLLLFGDSTLGELERQLAFASSSASAASGSLIRDALAYLRDPESEAFDPDVLRTALNEEPNGLFYAHIVRRGEPLMFMIHPYEAEAVRLFRRAKAPGARVAEVIAQFPAAAPGGARAAGGDRVREATVRHYALEVWLQRNAVGNLFFSARARLDLATEGVAGPWIPLELYWELTVDSARWSDGRPASVAKPQHSPTVWIQLPPDGGTATVPALELFYHGDLIDRFASFFFIKSSASWYPRSLEGRSPATFDMTYHSPASYSLASVGERVEQRTDGKVVTSRWLVRRPKRNASFNVGQFETLDVPGDSGPSLSLLYSEEGHRAIRNLFTRVGLGKVNKKDVATDLSQSLKFFHRLYGELPISSLYATEIPYGHGEAFPGLLHLSWGTFEPARDSRGAEDVFRAHEVAHQWWGVEVDFATYHDQWLSEGFAEFSGLWYMQIARRNNELYFDMLRRWRDELLEKRATEASAEGEVGPISLGYRTASSSAPGAYGLMVYRKGAWVLHMLRVLMLDLRTVKEDAFTATMRDFYASFAGRRAATDDFRQIAERHAGMPLDWFFTQWVEGTGIPTYRVASRWEPVVGGKWRMRVRVRQSGVPEDFRMPVPIAVDLGENRFARLRIDVRGPVTEVDLPLLPSEPKGLRFNELEGVLCEVKLEKW